MFFDRLLGESSWGNLKSGLERQKSQKAETSSCLSSPRFAGVVEHLPSRVPRRIGILRALHLGDLLCAVPAFRALRTAYPRARITLIGLPWARAFVERYRAHLNDFLEFPGYPGLPERLPQLAEMPRFLGAAHRRRFDIALQMHGNGSITNPLIALLGAPVNAGYVTPGRYCPDPDRFLIYPESEHEIRRHLRLMEFLGIPPQGEALEFPLSWKDHQELRALPGTGDLRPGEYACVHPGGRSAERWPPERFARVADALTIRRLRTVLTGTAEERSTTRAVAEAMAAVPLDLAGQTSLGAVAALLSRARVLVCNDTGVSHLAAALGTPSVVIFITSDPARWAPLDRQKHRIAGSAGRATTAETVIDHVDALLAET
jgi:ADP-heptose:LPS heptosyltransferase